MRQTIRLTGSPENFGNEFESRLRALSRVQGLLARTDYQAIDLAELVWAELTAHGDGSATPGKVRVEGSPVAVSAGSAQALALALTSSLPTLSSTGHWHSQRARSR